MLRKLLLLGFILLLSCNKDVEKSKLMLHESKKANILFDNIFDSFVDRSPTYQSYLGIKKDQDKWDDISESRSIEDFELRKSVLKMLKDSINYELLDAKSKLSYDLLQESIKEDIESFKYRLNRYPVNQMFGVHSRTPAFLINIHKITDKKDAMAYLSRIEKIPHYFDQLIDNLKLREANGVVPPKFVFPRVLDDCKSVIKGYPISRNKKYKNAIYKDFSEKVNKLTISDKEKSKLIKKCSLLLKNNFKPAYKKLIVFLTGQAKRANTDDGVWKLPSGDEYYKFRLKSITTTNMTPDEIFSFGKQEVDRIHNEMNAIMKKVNFKGSLQDFFKYMREDKQFYYPNTKKGKQEYLDKATALIDTMRTRLDKLFITKPKAPMIVKRVESFREKSAGTAFYNQPAPDGSRPGVYYANLYNMKNMPKYQMEALAYHEGIPGHHMQIALAQELTDIPKFRKYGRYTAYVEGWGLYSEFIPKELGFYEDPYSDFGRLAMELWRACRLVVDVGIHNKKWTREKAIKYYRDNTPDSERDCIRMVERHIVMPGQATAYKIGMNKIMSLRSHAKNMLGEKFDIREFHEVTLTNGPLPLNILENLVEDYISSKKQ